jgi:group I intron endonuclease
MPVKKAAKKVGIYTITASDGRQYVGSSIDLQRRFIRHLSELRCRRHPNYHLQKIHDEQGEGSLRIDIVFSVLDYHWPTILAYEQAFIDELRPELNLCPIAGSVRGIKRSDEFKANLSRLQKGVKKPEAHRQAHIYGKAKVGVRESMSRKTKINWTDPAIYAARSKKQKVNVTIGRTTCEYESVREAFTYFQLPDGMHKRFRAELKKCGRETFTYEGVDYLFELIDWEREWKS